MVNGHENQGASGPRATTSFLTLLQAQFFSPPGRHLKEQGRVAQHYALPGSEQNP